MYLYLRADLQADEDTIPAELLKRTGVLELAMELELTPGRKLARVDTAAVLQALDDQGWFLQMPPQGLVSGHLYHGD